MRLKLPALVALAGALTAAATPSSSAIAGSAWSGTGSTKAPSSAQLAAATLTLVNVTATNTYSPQNWKVDTGSRTAVGTFPWGTGTYHYELPNVIPPSGAAGKLTMTIQASQRWATGFSLSGDVDFSPQPAIDESTDRRGLSFTAQRAFTVKPREYREGTKFVDIVGHAYYNEGPTFTFRYRVDSGPAAGGSGQAAPSSSFVDTFGRPGQTKPHTVSVAITARTLEFRCRWANRANVFDARAFVLISGGQIVARSLSAVKPRTLRVTRVRTATSVTIRVSNLPTRLKPRTTLKFAVVAKKLAGTKESVKTLVQQKR